MKRKGDCPLDREYGDIVCRNGVLWALTYSEMGPPDSRQWFGECADCARRAGHLRTPARSDDNGNR